MILKQLARQKDLPARQVQGGVDATAHDDRMGTDQVRDVDFEGDLMVLKPPMKPYGARVEQRVLRWRKIADV